MQAAEQTPEQTAELGRALAQERVRAGQEQQRAEHLAEQLGALGVEPTA